MVCHSVREGERLLFGILHLAQMAIAFGGKQFIEMAEAGQGRNQFHIAFPAVSVQFQYFFRRKGRFIPPHFGESLKHIGMFNIKLELVDFITAQQVRQLFQVWQLLDTPPGLVKIISAVRDVRLVVDGKAGKHAAALLDDLAEGLDTVHQPLPAASLYFNPFLRYPKAVALPFRSRHNGQVNIPLLLGSLYCRRPYACPLSRAFPNQGYKNPFAFTDLRI
ncbi:hypothetical protein IMSAGC019_04023 [Lachnospiraceae bacterium]|nr:hypothetical protein IMSAGC019_04023 [Lachnospiraceae bacterium]